MINETAMACRGLRLIQDKGVPYTNLLEALAASFRRFPDHKLTKNTQNKKGAAQHAANKL